MENKATLNLNMILKETESVEMIQRVLNSVKDQVDGMYIAITYKESQPKEDDELVTFLRSEGCNVFFFKWIYDFAAARQFILDQTPKGPQSYIIWLDADDVLKGEENLRTIFQEAAKSNWAAVFFDYWYMVDLDENQNVREIIITHKRERIVRNDDTFKWIGKLHETLIEQRSENVVKIFRNECVVVHLSTDERVDSNLERNIQILEEAARQEQHKDPRTIIYLAKAYYDKARFIGETQKKIYFDLSLTLFTEYLQGSGTPGTPGYQEGSGWPEERASAWSYIADIAILNQQYNVALKALQNALIEAPEFPIYYITLAMVWCLKGDYKKGKHWLQVATSIKEPETTLITNPRDLKTKALEVDYNIALAENDLERALKDSELLIDILPNVPELKTRLEIIKNLNAANKASQSIVYLGKYLEDHKEKDKIIPLLAAIPKDLEQEKFVSEMKHLFIPPRQWGDKEIAILCGPGFEEWSPQNLSSGIGGSEEAVIYLSRELTKQGYKVTVFANPGENVGNYEGVEYRPWYDINIHDSFNVLILWRNIGFVDFNPKSRFTMVWMHDVPSNPEFTEERINKIDKIAVLSEYHKSLFRMFKDNKFEQIPDHKFFLTRNGITSLEIPKKLKRDPFRCIWTSSYDRGLIYLLRMWADIKKAVPKATLDIYYGWNLYDALHKNNPARMKWKAEMMKLMQQDGITERGRVGHNQLHKELAQSGVWTYPTDFEEISCISAMKAQALGAIPVCTNYAALMETVKNGLRVDIDITTQEGQEEYKKVLIDLLNDPQKQESIRFGMQEWAKKYFPWSGVAEQWQELFDSSLKGKEFLPIQEKPLSELVETLQEGDDKDAR